MIWDRYGQRQARPLLMRALKVKFYGWADTEKFSPQHIVTRLTWHWDCHTKLGAHRAAILETIRGKPSETSSSPVLRWPGIEKRVVRGPFQAAKTPRKGQPSSPAHVDLLPLLWLCFSFWNDRWRWEFHIFRDVKNQVLWRSELLLWV